MGFFFFLVLERLEKAIEILNGFCKTIGLMSSRTRGMWDNRPAGFVSLQKLLLRVSAAVFNSVQTRPIFTVFDLDFNI